MYYVYIIQSELNGSFYYGFTTRDVIERLKDYNKGDCEHTKKFRPWKLIWFAGFTTKQKALDFERYLKTGSGRAFSNKRLK